MAGYAGGKTNRATPRADHEHAESLRAQHVDTRSVCEFDCGSSSSIALLSGTTNSTALSRERKGEYIAALVVRASKETAHRSRGDRV